MPKVTTSNARFGEYGSPDQISFKYDVYVTTSGIFSTKLPPEVVGKLEACGIPVATNKLGNKGYIEGRTIDELSAKIHAYDTEYQSKELVSTEIVIQYILWTDGQYWKDSKGLVYLNGDRGQTGEDWERPKDNPTDQRGFRSGLSGRNGNGFGLSLKVRVIEKARYEYKSGRKQTKTSRPTFSKEDTPALYWLNGYTFSEDVFKYDPKEVPATEENAEFFVYLIKALIALNEKVADFVDPKAILALVESKQKLLL